MCQAGMRVIVYSHMFSDEVILTSLELGAVTYLVKSEGQRHLIDAIRTAHSAEPYVGPRMGKALLSDTTTNRIKLSEREKEVLVAWFQTESKDSSASGCISHRPRCAPTCSAPARNTPRRAAQPPPSPRCLPAPWRTASLASRS